MIAGPFFSKLVGKEVVPCGATEWAQYFEIADRRVAEDCIGEIRVSTVFLGLDHQFIPGAPPHLFETMVFGGPMDLTCVRCSTWDEAEAQHKAIVAKVRTCVRQCGN